MLYYDLHTHTSDSDGVDCLEEILRAGASCGLEFMAISDHYNPQRWTIDLKRQCQIIRAAAEKYDFHFFHGVEAEVVNLKGDISITAEEAASLDIVLVHMGIQENLSVKNGAHFNKAEALERVCSAAFNLCDNVLIDIFAHPFNLKVFHPELRLEDLPEYRLQQIADKMANNDIAFEIMNNMWWWFPHVLPKEFNQGYRKIVELFARRGVKFSLGSDAHSVGGVGNLSWSLSLLKEAGLREEQLISLKDIFKKQKLNIEGSIKSANSLKQSA